MSSLPSPSPEEKEKEQARYCEVVIIGAGVSGLQCATSLVLEEENNNNRGDLTWKDVVILEARNRIGGRVHTRHYSVPQRRTKDHQNDSDTSSSVLWIDDGAAWVHGVEPIPWETTSNDDETTTTIPFYPVNEQQKLENPVLEHLALEGLNQVAGPGNPWTRPYSILHQTQNMALFVPPPSTDEKEATSPTIPLIYEPQVSVNDEKLSNNNNNALIRASIRRHFQIMRRVNEQVNDMYHEGLGMEANTDVTLSSALQHWNKAVPLDNNSDDPLSANTIQSLTNFYQHMLTYWQGLGLGEIPIAQYGGFDDSDDDDDDDPLEDDDEFDQDGDFGGAHCTIQQGMQQVVQGLAVPDLVEQIQLQQEVIRIEQVNQQQQQQQNEKDQPYRVRVETKDGSIIYARSCAVTIPIGCLRDNYQELFASPLSPEKVEAFQTLTMGRYKKVFLTFDSIFWPAQQAFLGMNIPPSNAPTPHPLGTCLLIDNFWAKDGHACMEAILAGDQARWATHKSDEMIRETVLEFIRTAMNLPYKLQDKCLDCHITRWEEDPFCKGAYAAMSMGGLQRHIDAVTEPEWDGCLYFAGDVCSVEFEGSVSAAMFSGRYTGRNMAQYLRNQRGTGPTEQSTISNGVVTSGEEVLETFPKEKEQLLSSVSYEDHDWRELPNHVQQAATQLGYNKRMWDRDLEPPSADLDWDELSPEQQRSASVIGFNKETWDCE